MFTGIIEEVGTILGAGPLANGISFRIGARKILEDLRPGDSIAVDGVCLTATEIDQTGFSVQCVGTTLERTTLGGFSIGQGVNLERAVAVGHRLGGHLVQGHVDGVGRILRIERRHEHVLIDFSLPSIVADVTILHGSITLNGISLTVNALMDRDRAQVSIIPYTWAVTALSSLNVGSLVNLEGDLIGKYVRHLASRADSQISDGSEHPREQQG